MSHDLFRKEVMEAKRGSWLGEMSLAQPAWLWALIVAAVVSVSVIVAFIMFGTYVRRFNVTVQTAPVVGVMASRTVRVVQAVQTGQPLLSLLSGGGELEAQLLVPSCAIGFIVLGEKALLRYQAFPYQKFGHHQGKVASVGHSELSTGELDALIGNAQQGELFYLLTMPLDQQAVMAYGQPKQLKSGMLLDADIPGEKRRLIRWIFGPLSLPKGKVGSG